jgi:hypothetical protein
MIFVKSNNFYSCNFENIPYVDYDVKEWVTTLLSRSVSPVLVFNLRSCHLRLTLGHSPLCTKIIGTEKELRSCYPVLCREGFIFLPCNN